MTQEEKQLLLQDICGRLPYGVMIEITSDGGIMEASYDMMLDAGLLADLLYSEDGFKPYLRPMSSMTDEEREELSDYLCERVMSNKIGITIPPNPTHGKGIPFIWMGDCLDWLNAHHFDYRGLIPMGLALEASEGMYK